MHSTASALPSSQYHAAAWKKHAAAVLLITLGLLALSAFKGFPALTDSDGDSDSLLRLVEVRDLLAGQGWFDLHQYRMGLEGGFVMHWSRLVDAPIAAIILLAQEAGLAPAAADQLACIVWPLSLFAASLFFILRAVRAFAGEEAILPAFVVGGAALFATGIFTPGNLDHHNVQLMLALAMIGFLLGRRASFAEGAAAGTCAALMLAVGMETLPYIAVGGACVAVSLMLSGAGEMRRAAGFGLSFGGVALAVMATTVRPSEWMQVRCDAFSAAQFSVAAISGIGLVAIALAPALNRSLARRAAALTALAVILAVVAIVFFPQCLGSPYAALDPRLQHLWLDRIEEAQPATRLIVREPTAIFQYFITPLLALAVLAVALFRHMDGRRPLLVLGALLLTAVLVSVWQVRGTVFSIPFAAIVLSAWIGKRRMAAESGSAADTVKMVAAWLTSVSLVWAVLALGTATAMERLGVTAPASDGAAAEAASCYDAGDYSRLAALPAGTVLAPSNLGVPILRYTRHRVFAGPYHRNVAGMLIALDAFMAPAPEARRIANAHNVDFLAVCPGNAETRIIAADAPQGLMADLKRGNVPDWLRPVTITHGAPLEIFRVVGRRKAMDTVHSEAASAPQTR